MDLDDTGGLDTSPEDVLLRRLVVRLPQPFQVVQEAKLSFYGVDKGTDYLAESLSWYSLDRAKHSCTPESAQSLFIAARSSSEKGSVSSIRATTSMTNLAST